jgi:amino acid transporter
LVLAVYVLMPFGVSGLAGQKAIEADPTTFYSAAFAKLFGGHGSVVMTVCLIAGLLLMMLMTSADGGRVLYGSSRDGLTLRQLGQLNRFKVPGRAMTLDFVLNVVLVLFIGNTLAILIAGNLGYVLMHVFAISGFLLLRKDRPNAHRPIRLGAIWTPLAAGLVVVDLLLLYFGVTHSSVTGYGGTRELVIGVLVLSLSVVLYLYRVLVQDKAKLRWRSPEGDEVNDIEVPPDVQISRFMDPDFTELEPAGE